MKTRLVREQLERTGGFVSPPVTPAIGSDDPWAYRNHARFTIGPEGQLGFVNRTYRRFVRIDECLIMDRGVNDLLTELQGKAGETTQLSIRYGPKSESWLIQPTLQSLEIGVKSGQTHYEEEILGRRFRVAAASFFQVNVRQAERLVGLVRESLDLHPGEVLVDAYAGVGVFAALLAPHVREVIAVEESAAAVADARKNVEGLDNVRLVEAKTEHALAELDAAPDALILDPPRAGCHPGRAGRAGPVPPPQGRLRLLRPGDAGARPQTADRGSLRPDRSAAARHVPPHAPHRGRRHTAGAARLAAGQDALKPPPGAPSCHRVKNWSDSPRTARRNSSLCCSWMCCFSTVRRRLKVASHLAANPAGVTLLKKASKANERSSSLILRDGAGGQEECDPGRVLRGGVAAKHLDKASHAALGDHLLHTGREHHHVHERGPTGAQEPAKLPLQFAQVLVGEKFLDRGEPQMRIAGIPHVDDHELFQVRKDADVDIGRIDRAGPADVFVHDPSPRRVPSGRAWIIG